MSCNETKIPSAEKSDPMADAIRTIRAGRCLTCNQVRAERQSHSSAGFGQGTKTETFFVCGNPQCANHGKP